jgi:solute:Na+ symporter, SSS family
MSNIALSQIEKMKQLTLTSLDLIIMICLILFQVGVGIYISLKGKDSNDYFMAGRTLKWWAVGGSVFSTNVSATHLIGMLGIGYSVGFAQSHYEILAVFAILLLAFVFVPIYRSMKIFTLSQFLEKRFGEHARLVYALLILLLIIVQLVANFYIGARALSLLTSGSAYAIDYPQALLLLAVITCSYTFFGGLKAVVFTDTIQAIFIIVVAVLLSWFTFSQPEINGFSGLLQIESQLPEAEQKMKLFLPSNHPSLPFTGVFTGLILLHCFYWITNQFLVQRVIAAKTDRDAKVGVMFAGFLKLGIPFVSIATGIAAAHYFRIKNYDGSILPDDAFLHLVNEVVPAGFGLIGIIFSGVAASTFSTVDSMMNSATTIFSIDIYKKYLHKNVSDKALVRVGRITIGILALSASLLAWLTYNPKDAGNFFLKMSSHGSYFTPGIIVVFFAAVFIKNIPPKAALLAMLSAPLFAFGSEYLYEIMAVNNSALQSLFGTELNFLHRVAITFLLSGTVMFLVKWLHIYWSNDLKSSDQCKTLHSSDELDRNKALLSTEDFKRYAKTILFFFLIQLAGILLVAITPLSTASFAIPIAIFTGLLFLVKFPSYSSDKYKFIFSLERFMAALLSGITIWISYRFW